MQSFHVGRRLGVALMIAASMSTAHAASFNCAKARTLVEQEICKNPTLSKLDDALDRDYKRVDDNLGDLPTDGVKEVRELKRAQNAWLKERNRCTSAECLIESYRKRINALCDEIQDHDGGDSGKQCRAKGGLGGLDAEG